MPKEECVANDFEVTPRDYMSIITGSNMSGKSTFLRTVGLNMILGYCGTRVAAQSMHYSIVDLITYMRIKDALEENVSTFIPHHFQICITDHFQCAFSICAIVFSLSSFSANAI